MATQALAPADATLLSLEQVEAKQLLAPLSWPRLLKWALVLSVLAHGVLVWSFNEELHGLFRAFVPAPPRTEPIRARLAPAPVIERAPAVVAPPPVRPGAAQAIGAPVAAERFAKPAAPKTDPAAKASNATEAAKAAPSAAEQNSPPSQPSPNAQPAASSNEPPAAPQQKAAEPTPPETVAAKAEPAPLAPAPKLKAVPYPSAAHINFHVIRRDKYREYSPVPMVQEWRQEGGQYTVRAEASGLGFSFKQTSRGNVGEKGLEPQRFEARSNDDAPVTAEFDIAAKTANIKARKGERQESFAGVPTDQLSLLYDLGINLDIREGHRIAFAFNNGNIYRYTLKTKGRETIDTPAGALDTIYFAFERDGSSRKIEVWLALDRSLLPARMRLDGSRAGEELDIVVTRYRLGQ
jgi:hypothetical protein